MQVLSWRFMLIGHFSHKCLLFSKNRDDFFRGSPYWKAIPLPSLHTFLTVIFILQPCPDPLHSFLKNIQCYKSTTHYCLIDDVLAPFSLLRYCFGWEKWAGWGLKSTYSPNIPIIQLDLYVMYKQRSTVHFDSKYVISNSTSVLRLHARCKF